MSFVCFLGTSFLCCCEDEGRFVLIILILRVEVFLVKTSGLVFP